MRIPRTATTIILLTGAAAAQVSPPQFRVTLLAPSAPGEQTTAAAVDASGRVVGSLQHATGLIVHSAFWPDPAQPPVVSTGEGADFSAPLDINEVGVVVGQAHEGSIAYTWVPGEDIQPLGVAGPCCPSANALSDGGVVVGFAVFGAGGQRPTRWVGGVPADLGVVVGDSGGLANDISESGHIVGQSGNEAAHWMGGAALRLPFPGTVLFSIAHEVNLRDEIVGEVSDGGPSRAVVWSDGVPTELPSLGGTWTAAYAINEASWIVGLAQAAPQPADVNVRASLWIDGQPFDLNALTLDLPPDVRLMTARDVNDAGVIVGDAFDFGSGLARGFVLQPAVPVWMDAGGGLAGGAGVPALVGSGTLEAGTPTGLSLSGAAPGAPATLVLGFGTLGLPFKGGVLVPQPALLLPLTSDAMGETQLSAMWPAGVPGGLTLVAQFWIADAGGAQGFAASNALQATAATP